MSLANSSQTYGSVTKTFHWLTALLIVTLIPLGIYANGLPYETSEELALKAQVFSMHKTLGVFAFFVALARIVWALSQPKPAPLHPDRKAETLAAEVVHWLLYGSLVLVPLSGWIHHAATSGFAPIWWPLGQDLPLVPKSEALASLTAGLHIVFERVLVVSVFLHVAGALKHRVIDRDATLARMLPGTPNVPQLTDGTHSVVLPAAVAAGVWVVALFIGSTLGVYDKHTGSVQAAALEDVQSDWVVESGAVNITVTQLGSDVQGQFADWTASISFDDSVTEGVAGAVEVTLSIGSLKLGSVSSQAMGADFFNAEAFPTATYSADIIASADGYTSQGTLTIKDQTMPVTFPFDLSVESGVARMTATTSLDRRDFAIGTGTQPDEGNIGFGVGVDISLTARETSE